MDGRVQNHRASVFQNINLSSSELKGIQPWLLIKIAGEAEDDDFFAYLFII